MSKITVTFDSNTTDPSALVEALSGKLATLGNSITLRQGTWVPGHYEGGEVATVTGLAIVSVEPTDADVPATN